MARRTAIPGRLSKDGLRHDADANSRLGGYGLGEMARVEDARERDDVFERGRDAGEVFCGWVLV